jgi:hypothetical protein
LGGGRGHRLWDGDRYMPAGEAYEKGPRERYVHKMHVHEMHVYEMRAHKMHAPAPPIPRPTPE